MDRIGPGARVADRYVVIEEIGGGGMGVVYLARDEQLDREVALKVLREAAPAEATRRMQREARATTVLDPTRVAQVYEVGETPDHQLYLVMEFVRGKTARALLREGRIEQSKALHIIREVATTLGEAHRAGLVHRDVKPDNVIVRDDGSVVLLDFGIVKHLEGDGDTAQLSTQLTTDGTVIGTPAYLAPEQALGRDIGPEVDQFALAVMAFELLTGKLPWTATDVTRMLAQVLGETPLSVSTIDRKLQPAFDIVLHRALTKATTGRFRTIEEFASALTAAERGEVPPSPASETLGGAPALSRSADMFTQPPAPRARRRLAGWLTGGVLLCGTATAWVVGHGRAPIPTTTSPDLPSLVGAKLSAPDARLACPIFEVRGATEIAGRLGAAGATLACARAAWYLGGREDRVLPPGALLDVPAQPVEGYANPYGAPEERAKTIERARARATAYLDGLIARGERDSWHVDLSVHAVDGVEVARSKGDDATALDIAIKKAVEALWSAPPLVRLTIDPEVARWTSFPDTDVGLVSLDIVQLGTPPATTCSPIAHRATELGGLFARLNAQCEEAGASTGVATTVKPRIDESSAPALVASVEDVLVSRTPIAADEERRLAAELDGLRAHEPTVFGRASLANAASMLWADVGDPERAHAALLAAVGEDPLALEAWQHLVFAAAATGSSSQTSAIASAWFPWEPLFMQMASSKRSDDLDARLRESRMAYLLEPSFARAAALGRALAEAGRPDEVRALAAAPIDGPGPSPHLEAYLLALIDLHDAKLDHSVQRLEMSGVIGLVDLVVVSRVLARLDSVATTWATDMLKRPDKEIGDMLRTETAAMMLCMHARADVASRCLKRIATTGHAAQNWWGVGGADLLRGAQRYAAGDVKGAVAVWRSLVAGPSEDIARVLPTDAFERAGEPDLAARLDARKTAYRYIAGVSDAAPREAKRALARGDRARAKELAQKVIAAWEVADAAVPAVAEMQALVRGL